MQFVIDESSWLYNGHSASDYAANLEELLDRLDDVSGKFPVFYSEDLFSIKLYLDLSFYDLYGPDSPIDIQYELRERIAAAFSRLARWQDTAQAWPENFDVAIDGAGYEFAPSVAWAHAAVSSKIHTAVFSLKGVRAEGIKSVELDGGKQAIWFISTASGLRSCARSMIIQTTNNPREFAVFSDVAFPGLHFLSGSVNGIKTMSKPYAELMEIIVKHLGVLSDHGARIFSGPWQRASSEFGSLGVEISDENGSTKSNSIARSARSLIFRGRREEFWWHTKLQPDRDRIYLCPNLVRTDGIILVGIFSAHLPT